MKRYTVFNLPTVNYKSDHYIGIYKTFVTADEIRLDLFLNFVSFIWAISGLYILLNAPKMALHLHVKNMCPLNNLRSECPSVSFIKKYISLRKLFTEHLYNCNSEMNLKYVKMRERIS